MGKERTSLHCFEIIFFWTFFFSLKFIEDVNKYVWVLFCTVGVLENTKKTPSNTYVYLVKVCRQVATISEAGITYQRISADTLISIVNVRSPQL